MTTIRTATDATTVPAVREGNGIPISQQLIDAQEQERGRIARDLHDGIGQQLAVLQIWLDELSRVVPPSMTDVHRAIDRLSAQTTTIADGVRTLSHDLHVPQLALLGLERALTGLCAVAGQQQGVHIHTGVRAIRAAVPPDVSVCLYRVLQEALTNATKHSGSRLVQVEVLETAGTIQLGVRDFGRGFAVDGVHGGLGLVSMRERVAMVNGALTITSTPGVGTEITVNVPVRARPRRTNQPPRALAADRRRRGFKAGAAV